MEREIKSLVRGEELHITFTSQALTVIDLMIGHFGESREDVIFKASLYNPHTERESEECNH